MTTPIARFQVNLNEQDQFELAKLEQHIGARTTAEAIRRAVQLCNSLMDALTEQPANKLFIGTDKDNLVRVLILGL